MSNTEIFIILGVVFFIVSTVLAIVLSVMFFVDIAYSSHMSNKTGVKQYWLTGKSRKQVCSIRDIVLDKVKTFTFSIIFVALLIVFISFFVVE